MEIAAELFPHLSELADGGSKLKQFRDALARGDAMLRERFDQDEPVDVLVRDRARLVDGVLGQAWSQHAGPLADELALVAVGGYGRGELHPCSDIDIMILLPRTDDAAWRETLETFLTFLWDIGLEVGHSVRTVEDCVDQAGADITVATTLMESRLLDGPRPLFEQMCEAVGPDHLWPTPAFFEAKLTEQTERHHRYHDTAYNLEPNVKGSPGGLRDIQMVGWVAKRHFNASNFHQLAQLGFLTDYEYRKLLAGQTFLWRIRWALHTITGRREDRLLFDHQIALAARFGYEDATYTLAVEQFMQKYYRTVMELSRLNEMLLQLFQEAILLDPEASPEALNPRFQVRNGYLEARHDEVFQREPSALLEIFKVLQERPELRGVSASTIRLIRKQLTSIDEEFRQNPRHHRLFLEIIRAPRGVTHELRRMNRYGVLGRYIPAFGRIVGRMQYDLFHAYTVDAHTLFVVSNLRRFALSRFDHELPALSAIMQSLPQPELIYLAGLFHDIAKGRGGDHSELGAVDAESFCLEQGLSRYEARLVAWLVANHLLFSITAQKKDIHDPAVIREFAKRLGDQTRLDYLYVLTVADIRATNPKLWNSWKASLFGEFYEATRRALRRGLENPIDKDELIAETQAMAIELLRSWRLRKRRIRKAWEPLTEEYFLRHTPAEIAWHTEKLLAHDPAGGPLVSVRQESDRGGTAVMVYTEYARRTFARVTAMLDELGLTIVDARITPTADDHSLDTYHVLENDGSPIDDLDRARQIDRALVKALLKDNGEALTVTRKAPRQVRMFSTATRISFGLDGQNRTLMELIAADRPGLLSEVGRVLLDAGVEVHAARIMTIGERAEDVFCCSDAAGRPLTDAKCEALRTRLIEQLDKAS
ncbi:MAG: [protein-PII] uridylyltransferase [Gammaproteobacteria bacterium]